jgi:hypothetical protein
MVTGKPHVPRRCCESVALHETFVVPTGNVDPLAGLQVVLTDDDPPVTTGAAKTTVAPLAVVACAVVGGGHARLNACCDGDTVEQDHEPPTSRPTRRNRRSE